MLVRNATGWEKGGVSAQSAAFGVLLVAPCTSDALRAGRESVLVLAHPRCLVLFTLDLEGLFMQARQRSERVARAHRFRRSSVSAGPVTVLRRSSVRASAVPPPAFAEGELRRRQAGVSECSLPGSHLRNRSVRGRAVVLPAPAVHRAARDISLRLVYSMQIYQGLCVDAAIMGTRARFSPCGATAYLKQLQMQGR